MHSDVFEARIFKAKVTAMPLTFETKATIFLILEMSSRSRTILKDPFPAVVFVALRPLHASITCVALDRHRA